MSKDSTSIIILGSIVLIIIIIIIIVAVSTGSSKTVKSTTVTTEVKKLTEGQSTTTTQTTTTQTIDQLIKYANEIYVPQDSLKVGYRTFLESIKETTRAQDEEKIKTIEVNTQNTLDLNSTTPYSVYEYVIEYNRACIDVLKKKLAEYTYPS